MSFQYSIIGALVPALVKKLPEALKKIFKLQPLDEEIKARVVAAKYPHYYKIGYALWFLCLFSGGLAAFVYFAIYLPIVSADFVPDVYWKFAFLGLINMAGLWLIWGAIFDQVFWQLSSDNFRDYVRYRNIKEGLDVDVPLQIKNLWKIGIGYYILFSPALYFLLL